MPVNLELVDNKFIRIDYIGDVTHEEFIGAFLGAVAKAKESGVLLFLADLRLSTSGPANFELFYKVESFEEIGVLKNMKEAVIFPLADPNSEQVRFYETTCRNRGYNVRIFNNYDEGLNWLLISE